MSNYDGVLQEEMDGKLDVILEYLDGLATVPLCVTELKTDMRDVKTRLTSIEIAVTD